MDYIANLYSMSDDKLSQEIMNLNKKLSRVNSVSPIYAQILAMINNAEAVRYERMLSSKFTEEDKKDTVIEIGSVDSVVYTPIYSQEDFLEVVAKMYLNKGNKQK
jgi:hypothetical protein